MKRIIFYSNLKNSDGIRNKMAIFPNQENFYTHYRKDLYLNIGDEVGMLYHVNKSEKILILGRVTKVEDDRFYFDTKECHHTDLKWSELFGEKLYQRYKKELNEEEFSQMIDRIRKNNLS